MLAASVSNDVWIGTALIAAIMVLSCLGFICTRIRYELELIRVVAGVKKLRNKMAQQLEEAGAQVAEQPGAGAQVAGSAGSGGTEEIPESQPDSEPVTPAAANAA